MLQMGRRRRWWHVLKIDGLILAVTLLCITSVLIGMVLGAWFL